MYSGVKLLISPKENRLSQRNIRFNCVTLKVFTLVVLSSDIHGSLDQWFRGSGGFYPLGDTWQHLGMFLVVTNGWRGAIDILWVKARWRVKVRWRVNDAAEHSTMHTQQATAKNNLTQNVNSAKIEKHIIGYVVSSFCLVHLPLDPETYLYLMFERC